MKKLLSVLLVMVALVSCMVLSVSAADTDVQTIQAYIDAQPEGALVELPSDITGNLTVSKTLYLQMNGFSINGTVTVNAGATLYGMDTATDDFLVDNAQHGKITAVVGSYAGVPAGAKSNEDSYVAVADEDGVVSFHRVKLEIYAMSLRVDATENRHEPGLYYKSHFRADEVAAAYLESHGVALSVQETPSEANLETKCRYSVIEGFEAGPAANLGNSNSTLLRGIMKNDNGTTANVNNMNMTVYGRAYAKTIDGQYVFGAPVQRSLGEQLSAIDSTVSSYSETQMANVINFYNKFSSPLASLNLTNIAQAAAEAEEGTLKVLVLGNSHSVDATYYLVEVFKTEAPSQKITVGVLYYSGCPMEYHSDFLTNNQPAYVYYKNTSTDSNTAWTLTPRTTCLTALQDEQWDVVVMQQMSRQAGVASYYNSDFRSVRNYLLNNVDYTPKLGFHVPWVSPDSYADFVDETVAPSNQSYGDSSWRTFHEEHFGQDGVYEMEIMYKAVTENVQNYLIDRTDILGQQIDILLPSVTAIQYAQDVRGQAQTHLYRDYTHTTDYGRLIAAYVWYAQLMNLSNIDDCSILTTLPSDLHHSNSQYPTGNSISGYKLSTTDKNDLRAAVNFALQNPLSLEEIEPAEVRDPLTAADVNALATKNASMTEAQMRDACYNFMLLSKTAMWTPSESAYYYRNPTTRDQISKGVLYSGMPYNGNGSGNIYRMLDYVDPATGILDMTDAIANPDLFGNHCTSSTLWAWTRVINSVGQAYTKDMTHANGFLRVDGYTYDDAAYPTFSSSALTKTICTSNGTSKMYAAYANLEKADGLVMYAAGGGHALMVSTVHVQKILGSISGTSSYVTVLEQSQGWLDYNGAQMKGYVEKQYTFKNLYDSGYLPFTFAEFQGTDPIEETTCSIDLTGTSVTTAQLFGATVSSNYSVSDVYITLKKADGTVAYRGVVRSTVAGAKTLQLAASGDNVFHWNDLSKLTGTYTIEVSAQLSTGERPVVYTGNITV